MIAVHRIFDLQLPVAAIAVLMDAAARVDFTERREVTEEVNLSGRVTEIVREAHPVGRDTAENKTAIGGDARQRNQAEIGFLKGMIVAVGIADGGERAVVAIHPAVIVAAEKSRITALELADGVGAMTASIGE